MTAAPAHLRLSIGGQLFADGQTWSIGLNYANALGQDPTQDGTLEDKLNSWRDAVKALYGGGVVQQDVRSILGEHCGIGYIRCSAVGADGKEAMVSDVTLGGFIGGGGGSAVLPGQVALAVTLLTGRPGASYRGRVYLPATGAVLGGTGRLSGATTQSIATGFAQWLHDLQSAGSSIINPQLTTVVASARRNVLTPITSVRVGDRLDIQRRRADKEKEAYSVAVVPQ